MSAQYNLYHISEQERGYPPTIVRTIEVKRSNEVPEGAFSIEALRRQEEQRARNAQRMRAGSVLGRFISESDCVAETDLIALARDLPDGAVIYEAAEQPAAEQFNTGASAHFART